MSQSINNVLSENRLFPIVVHADYEENCRYLELKSFLEKQGRSNQIRLLGMSYDHMTTFEMTLLIFKYNVGL